MKSFRCFSVNLLHVLKTPFPKNTSGRLRLYDVVLGTAVIHVSEFVSQAIGLHCKRSIVDGEGAMEVLLNANNYFFSNKVWVYIS